MDAPAEKLMQDLKTVVGDAEELVRATASQSGEHITRIRARAEAQAHEVGRKVRDNPWTALGIAAGVGVLLGILLARK